MAAIKFKGVVATRLSLADDLSSAHEFSTCRPTSCVFSFFIVTCRESLDSRLFVLNKVETSLNRALSASSHPNQSQNLCDCFFTGQEHLVQTFIDCIAADHILLKRSSTHCLRLLCRILICNRRPLPHLTDFISFIVKHGFSSNVQHNAKLSLCTALPQIFAKDVFESYKSHNQAIDFEPLCSTLLHLYTNTCGNKSPFRQAFFSLFRLLGPETYRLVVRRWERMCIDGLFPLSNLQLAQSWMVTLFTSRIFASHDYLTMREHYNINPDRSISVKNSLNHAIGSDSEVLLDAEDFTCFADLSTFLSRESYDVLFTALSSSGSPKSNEYCRNNTALCLAVEELRDSVIANMSSPAGRNLCFGLQRNTYSFNHTDELPSPEVFALPTVLASLLRFLQHLIHDSNFNLVVCCLQIASALMQPFLWQDFNLSGRGTTENLSSSFIWTVCDHLVSEFIVMLRIVFSHNNLVVRISASKLFLDIARVPSGPLLLIQRLIYPVLCSKIDLKPPLNHARNDQLQSERNYDRLCQELIDMLTSMLLTLPSSAFDPVLICEKILLNGLLNQRVSVRAATLDCVAVVAHILGPGNLSPLLAAVSEADSRLSTQSSTSKDPYVTEVPTSVSAHNTGSLLEAVQRRLARRQLPQLDSQGRVIRGFSSPTESGLSTIIRNGGSTGSLDRSDSGIAALSADLETCVPAVSPRTSSNCTMRSTVTTHPTSKGLRRRPSAVCNRTRLPWNPRTAVNGNSVASSSGVSSVTSPRGPDSNSSSATGTRTTITTETESEHERDITGDCVSPDFIPLRFPGPQAPKSAQIWPTGRNRRSNRATGPKSGPNGGSAAMQSKSVPTSGRISPISFHDSLISVDPSPPLPRTPRGSSVLTASDVEPCTPRRKPLLEPLKHKTGPPSVFSARPALGRQSGRSRQSSAMSSNRSDSREVTETPPIVSDRKPSHTCHSHRTNNSPTDTAEAYHDDYEEDDDNAADMGDIINDDEDDDDASISTFEGLQSARGTTEQRLDNDEKCCTDTNRSGGPGNRGLLCRSVDSELSGVTSIRSAASHRRALRLFEEAERRRRLEESNARTGPDDITCEPTPVSVVDSSCPMPTLAPAVSPALSTLRPIAPGKATAHRRGIQQIAPQAPQLSHSVAPITNQRHSCPPINSASHSSVSTDSNLPANNSTEYNPYKGASFRENPGYAGLVVGRAAASTVQCSSTQEPQRSSHFPPTGERKPLKGQHNIHTGPIFNAHSDIVATMSTTSASIASSTSSAVSPSSSINVVGRGLFGPHHQLTSIPCALRPHPSVDASNKTDRNAPPGSSGTEHSSMPIAPPPSECYDDRPIKPSVLSLGALAVPGGVLNTDPIEIKASNSVRERALQRKTSELQRLKKRPSANLCHPAGDEETRSVSNDYIPPLDGDHIVHQPPSNATWPPPGRLHSSPSRLVLDTGDGVSPRFTNNPASGAAKQTDHLSSESTALQSALRSGSHHHPATLSSGKQCSPVDETLLHEIQSVETVSGGSRGTQCNRFSPTHPSALDKPDRPLLRGRSGLNAQAACPSLQQALQLISSEDWEAKVSGLEAIAQIALNKPSTFCATVNDNHTGSSGSSCTPGRSAQFLNPTEALNQAVQAVITECRNLRSQVSRQAVHTLSGLFHELGRNMDPHVESSVRILLGKTGEAAAVFLRDEVAVAMNELAHAANPSKVLVALLQHGLGHKNAAVRLKTALHISQLVESVSHVDPPSQGTRTTRTSRREQPFGSMSTSQRSSSTSASQLTANMPAPAVISGLMDRLVTALSQFLTDGNQETRYYGRRLLNSLMHYSDFERSVRKHLSGQMLRVVHEAMDQLQTKGVGEFPRASAGVRRGGYSPASNQRLPRGSSVGRPPCS
ncbi:unnamed protein product [Dicrocoelium dendriticum]|nr:unnamed protein product [Dicrocoelium dendriticum]